MKKQLCALFLSFTLSISSPAFAADVVTARVVTGLALVQSALAFIPLMCSIYAREATEEFASSLHQISCQNSNCTDLVNRDLEILDSLRTRETVAHVGAIFDIGGLVFAAMLSQASDGFIPAYFAFAFAFAFTESGALLNLLGAILANTKETPNIEDYQAYLSDTECQSLLGQQKDVDWLLKKLEISSISNFVVTFGFACALFWISKKLETGGVVDV
jgi:hypothetical protein